MSSAWIEQVTLQRYLRELKSPLTIQGFHKTEMIRTRPAVFVFQ